MTVPQILWVVLSLEPPPRWDFSRFSQSSTSSTPLVNAGMTKRKRKDRKKRRADHYCAQILSSFFWMSSRRSLFHFSVLSFLFILLHTFFTIFGGHFLITITIIGWWDATYHIITGLISCISSLCCWKKKQWISTQFSFIIPCFWQYALYLRFLIK